MGEQQTILGLTQEEVLDRKEKGKINIVEEKTVKSNWEIISGNVFTLFNLYNFLIAIALMSVGAYSNLAFMLIIILNICIGSFQEIHAKNLVAKLSVLTVSKVDVIREGREISIDVDEVVLDDITILNMGNQICSDSVVIDGKIEVNESLLTGESDTIIKLPGDKLFSGSYVVSGKCYAKVEKVGKDNLAAEITLKSKKHKKINSELLSSMRKVTKLTSLIIIPVGALLFIEAYFVRNQLIKSSVISTSAALLGMLPKGLVLLISISLATGVIKLAKKKVLVQDLYSVETLAHVDTLCLDKTGTITEGEPKVTDIITGDRIPQNELIAIAYGLERKSEHPLAKAVVNYVEESGDKNSFAEEVTDFKAVAGNGLKGMLDTNVVAGGNLKFISEYCNISDDLRNKADDLSSEGKTPLFFVRNNKLLGIIAVADTIKKDSPQAIRELQNMGIRVVMITGDNERSAKAIGKLAGVDEVIAGVLPEGKEKEIARLKEQGSVIMVGDGINDAPALTRADIGIAIGAGTDVAIDAADIVLMKNRLSDVPAAIRLSKRTLTNIHENLFWAFFYNCIGIPLAAGAWIPVFGWTLNPMFGAAAMSLSSFCVVTNALRLNFIKIYDTGKDHIYKKKSSKNKNKTTKGDKTMTKTMNIEGMMCGHCEAAVKKALEAVDGVTEAVVSHENGTAVVTLCKEVDNDVLKKAVEDKDYKVTAVK